MFQIKRLNLFSNTHEENIKSNDLLRVPLIARSWDPGSEEVETQVGNGRAREGEKERGREKSVAFVCKII